MLYRNCIVRIDHIQDTENRHHGDFCVKKDGVIYLSVNKGTTVSEVLKYLNEHWTKDVVKTGLIKRVKRTNARKIILNNPRLSKEFEHGRAKSKAKYHNEYPANKAKIIYTPM